MPILTDTDRKIKEISNILENEFGKLNGKLTKDREENAVLQESCREETHPRLSEEEDGDHTDARRKSNEIKEAKKQFKSKENRLPLDS